MSESSRKQNSIFGFLMLHRYSAVFLIVGVIAVGIGAFLVQDINTAMGEAEQIYDRSVRGLDLIGELQYQTQEARRNIEQALTTSDSLIQREYVMFSRETDVEVDRIIQEHNALLKDPEEILASQQFERNWRVYQTIRNDIIDLILEGSTSQAVRIDLSSGMYSFDAVVEDIHRIKQLYDEQAQKRLSELKSVFNLSIIKVGSMLGLILLLAGGVLNVMERGKRLKVIQQSEERLNAVIESINDGMFVVTHDGQVEMVNQAAEKRWAQRRDSMNGRQLSAIVPDLKGTPIPEAIKECVRTEQAMTIPNIKLKHDQNEHIYEARLFPFEGGATVFFNDVTERQLAEDERLRINKLESIGLLAGGIAHDFNNIMTGVLGYISFAKLDLPKENPVYDRLSEAEQAAIEAKALTQQLLAFAKGGAPVKEMVNISSLLVDATTFVLRGSTVRSEWDLPDDLWPVHVDTTQMNQVVHNLVINAMQAMPDGGVLTIRGTNLIFGSTTQIKGITIPPGFYIKLTFSDEGVGMTPEQLNNIFDPYFTTKDTGTGLGLTTVYTIIQRHDGAIIVDSTPGEGTTFEIYIPASSQGQDTDETASDDDQTLVLNGEGKILIMDDEPVVRDLAAKSMTQYGFEVVTTDNGADAIELYRQSVESGQPFQVVLMDLTIQGGMGGGEAISHLKEINPDVKAIVSSGYHNVTIMANYKDYGFCDVVSKPYRVQDLFETIQHVLNGTTSTQKSSLQNAK